MYRKVTDFLSEWKYETEATTKLYNMLTDESLKKELIGEARKIGKLAWHIVETNNEMLGKTGLKIEGPEIDSPVPDMAKEIADGFAKSAASVAEQVAKWSDDELHIEDEMYGDKWKRGTTLQVLIKHLAHHRGQLTMLMRLAGLKVHGVYGPAKEEWATWGMTAPE